MNALFDPVIKDLEERADKAGAALMDGTFKDFTEAKVLVERRRSLLVAIEAIKERAKADGDD